MQFELLKIHRAKIIPVPDEYGEIIGVALIGLVEIEGKLYKVYTVPVADLDEAYEIKKWCDTKVEPYEIEVYEAEDGDYS